MIVGFVYFQCVKCKIKIQVLASEVVAAIHSSVHADLVIILHCGRTSAIMAESLPGDLHFFVSFPAGLSLS